MKRIGSKTTKPCDLTATVNDAVVHDCTGTGGRAKQEAKAEEP